MFGYGVLLTSLLAIITPIAARYHVTALIGVRIFQGLFLVSHDIASLRRLYNNQLRVKVTRKAKIMDES